MNPLYNTLFVGKVLLELDTIDSTNSYAKDMLSKSKPMEGTAIIASFQQAGRGQIGKSWWSEPRKNVSCSIILSPSFLLPAQQFDLNMAVTLGVHKACSELLGHKFSVKWPNDIYYHELKVAGILIENIVGEKSIKRSVVGIGLNVNSVQFPDDLPNPTSLKAITGKTFQLDSVRYALFHFIEVYYLQLKSGKAESIRQEFNNHLYGLGRSLQFADKDGGFDGVIRAVNANGELEIVVGDQIRTYRHKEVWLQRDNAAL